MSIYAKLAEIQVKLKAPKSQYNSFGKYNYRSCEDILEAVKPLLLETKTTLLLTDELVMIGQRYYVKATATLIDSETSNQQVSVTAYAREEEEKKGMDGSQITGASSSYARKYALSGLFAIDDNKDSDETNQGDGKQDAIYPQKKASTAERQTNNKSSQGKLPNQKTSASKETSKSQAMNLALKLANEKGINLATLNRDIISKLFAGKSTITELDISDVQQLIDHINAMGV